MSVPRPARGPRVAARRRALTTRKLHVETLERREVWAGDVFAPVVGDWNHDGRDTLGLFNPTTKQFYLRDINAPGFPHRVVTPAVAPAGSVPVVGDWNGSGFDWPGLFDAAGGRFLLLNDKGQLYAERALAAPKGATPFAGDFNGDGRHDVGVFDPVGKTAALLVNAQTETLSFAHVPGSGPFEILAADFDGDQRDEVVLVDRATQRIHFADGTARDIDMPSEPGKSTIVAGNWGGHGGATLGWFRKDTGIFTPWYSWEEDVLAGSLYAVPSTNVQSHVDLPLARPWSNSRNAFDVNDDDFATPTDAAFVLASLNAYGSRALPEFRSEVAKNFGYLDTSGDGFLTPLDVLLIVNKLNSSGNVNAEDGVPQAPLAMFPQLSAAEVEVLLDRASAASVSTDAIIAVVDRGGRILGVRAEQTVLNNFAGDINGLVFAIDGAVAKARTAAFFANNQAPLTSRTVRFISQSTVTQREMQSNPNVGDMNSPLQGPGFVAPVGLGGHFPPEVSFTPPVDLFAIEHSNRDSLQHPGVDGIKGTGDDPVLFDRRFNVDPAYVPAGQVIEAPESYGFTSRFFKDAQSRGIATLPGGVPLYRHGYLVGGVGVFFPGLDGTATFEQNFVAGVGQTEYARTNAPKVLEAEWIAFATAGGIVDAQFPYAKIDTINGIPLPDGLRLPFGRIDLVGITLEVFGPHPTTYDPRPGVDKLLGVGMSVLPGAVSSGADQAILPGGNGIPGDADDIFSRDGIAVPEGWLVLPHAGSALAQADVERIIDQGVAEANLVRAAIRLPIGQRTKMVFAVADLDGEILGLYRMPDATVFSIDVAVAKSRNEAYYADATDLQPIDRVDDDRNGVPDASVPAGTSLTARTFRFLAEPRYPAGIDGTLSGAFSILRDPGINPYNAENLGPALPASMYTSVLGFDAFNVSRNFRDPGDGMGVVNQNGVVFFPGSTPLYIGNTLVGGLGTSGDGVDQDDVVTWSASVGYQTPSHLRADQYFVRGVRLPFQKFLRNPRG